MNVHDFAAISVKERGAFYTPEEMARKIAEWTVQTGGERILEPSAGEGSLAQALDQYANALGNGVSLVCCDIDPAAIAGLVEKVPGCTPIEADFIGLSPKDLGLFDAVAMNPPFTRNHALPASLRTQLRSKYEVSGAAGLWVYFLLHACTFLKVGGRIASILPASATFTDYGRSALRQVASRFASVEVRRIVDRPAWVNGADERGAILFAEGYRQGTSSLPTATSWTSDGERRADFFSGNPTYYRAALAQSVPLAELATVSIGCVTGNNSIFLLSEADRVKAGISTRDLFPIASRARHVPGILTSPDSLQRLAKDGEKTWLLAPKSLDERGSATRRWLAQIDPNKRRSTLWLNKRSPWWKVDLGSRCDALFTYMNHSAPRVVQTDGDLVCTNTLHRLTFLSSTSVTQRNATSLSFLSTFGQLSAELGGRSYGGGILKFELGEVRALPVLRATNRCRLENVRKAHELCLTGAAENARAFADKILLQPIFGGNWQTAVSEMEKELFSLRSERLNV